MAHKWAWRLCNPCRMGGGGGVPNASKWRKKSALAHDWAWCLHNSGRLGGSQRFSAWDKISSGPQLGLVAT